MVLIESCKFRVLNEIWSWIDIKNTKISISVCAIVHLGPSKEKGDTSNNQRLCMCLTSIKIK